METLQSANPENAIDQRPSAPLFLTPLSLNEIKALLHKKWRFIAKTSGAGSLIVAVIAILIPNRYTSTAQLMPPDPQTFNSSSSISAITGASFLSANLGTGGLMSQRTPGETAIAVLSSPRVLDDVINRFDLRKEYHYKFFSDTRKKLLENTTLIEDKRSGIITISVTDGDRTRAREIAQLFIEDLNKLVNDLSTSSARRERMFLEGRLNSIKGDLDTNARALSQFSSSNKAIDIQKQGEATVEAASKLEGELINAQSELSALKAVYTEDNVRVLEARARISELQRQLRKITGTTQDLNGANSPSDEVMPSIRKLPLLGFTYYDLFRNVTMEETLYETLDKQYELAKVREAEEISPIIVLDPPNLPEKKSFPPRLLIICAGGMLSLIAAITWVVICERKLICEELM